VGEQDVVAGAHELSAIAGLGCQKGWIRRPLPLGDEPASVLFEWGGEGSHSFLRGRVMARADAHADGELDLALGTLGVQVYLAEHGDVAAGGRSKFPVHPEVVHEVAPAVACAYEAAADAGEAVRGSHGQRPFVFPGEYCFVSCKIDCAGGVAGATSIEVRGQQRVDLQTREQGRIALNADICEDNGVVRIADDFLGQLVAALGIGVDIANAEGFRVDVFEGGLEVAFFLVNEGLAVGNEELHVADLGAVDGGVIDLIQDAMAACKPDAAGGCVGGSHRIFDA